VVRVVVVGAGIGGLAAAVAANRVGHEVVVMERDRAVRVDGVGIGMLPNAIVALDHLGLGEPLRTMASDMSGEVGIYDRHRRPLVVADQQMVEAATGARAIAVEQDGRTARVVPAYIHGRQEISKLP
jgi:2-polyprenyl-6-methoxyphenol hydroxylase-like FAD-dependent oxidoreductase